MGSTLLSEIQYKADGTRVRTHRRKWGGQLLLLRQEFAGRRGSAVSLELVGRGQTYGYAGSYTSEASGGSSIAGWTGGMITGALSGYGAGKAGTMFIAASDLTGTACLSQVALGGVTSFGFGAIGAGAGTITTAAINGQKLNGKDIFSAAVTGGAINMLAGVASAIGSGVYKMPAISETSKVAASALSTSWSIAAEVVCDAVSVVIGLIAN